MAEVRRQVMRFDDVEAECEIPPGRRWELHNFPDRARILRRSGDTVAAAVAAAAGFGIWRLDTGQLLWWNDVARCVRMFADTILSCDVLVHPPRLVLLSWPELTELAALDAPRHADELVVAPSEKLVVVYQLDGHSYTNGYQVFSLDGGLRLLTAEPGLTTMPMRVPPVISPQERQVVCAPGNGGFWVPDNEDDWPPDLEEIEIPSLGGLAKFGELYLHDLDTDEITRHELQFDLEPGWVPADPEDVLWEFGPIGLEFPAEDRIRLQQPDSTWVELSLPLPDTVLLPTPNRVLQPSEDST